MLLWFMTLFACSPEIMEIEGSIGGSSFTPMTAFYGGPYIVFFSREMDCKETYWITKIYRNGEAPYDRDLTALQIGFNDSDVVPGVYATGGQAPIRASFFTIDGEAFEVVTGTDGSLNSISIEDGWASGEFDFSFGDDILSGTYTIPFCTNLIP